MADIRNASMTRHLAITASLAFAAGVIVGGFTRGYTDRRKRLRERECTSESADRLLPEPDHPTARASTTNTKKSISQSTSSTVTNRDPFIPDKSNEGCPGIADEHAGKATACEGCPNQSICASGEQGRPDRAISEIFQKLQRVRRKVLVLSGKGGVGKSSVSAQLGFSLSAMGFDIGLMDVDICGPSLPRLMGLVGEDVHPAADGWSPVQVDEHLCVMSVGFLLPHQDDAVIWRGPRKNGLIKQFLTDVSWGELDLLLVDTPPGTSDEHLSIVTYLSEAEVDGAIVVTTPQEVAMADVRKEINFCKKVGIPILGVVENMAGALFCSPHATPKEMCEAMGGIPYLGAIPLSRDLVLAGETGQPVSSVASGTAGDACDAIEALTMKVIGALSVKAPFTCSTETSNARENESG